jgi:lysyl-tRNA synthetase class 1
MSDNLHKHWSEWLAQRVIDEKEEPYVITAGMTTSGPVHLGTLCEFLFPDAVRAELEVKGKKAEFFFIVDILDAFDSIPVVMEKYRAELEPHLGEPLCNVPDPTGKSKSFGDHFLEEAKDMEKLFGFKATLIPVNDLYNQGKFDEWARFYLEHEDESRKIVEESSGKQEKKDWSPIMPICENCGKIATTRVTSHDGENYEYVCDKDIKYTKGCLHKGKAKIADHKYKITWRLHWPAWKQIFKTSIEGAGVDHHTKGGSEDTCEAITKNLMRADYHIPFKYGFILFEGRKYSKSKGIGMGLSDLVKILPPEVIKYKLLKPDLAENVDINPTPDRLIRLIDEFMQAAEYSTQNKEKLTRHERKMAIAFELSTKKLKWTTPFLDVLLYYQIYNDWEKVSELVSDKEGVDYLRGYVAEWIKQDFIPEDYRFKYQADPNNASELAKEFISNLSEGMDALEIHNSVFDFAKSKGIEPKELFAQLYLSLIGKSRGPRLGKLIAALGVARVKKDFSG